VLYATRSTKKLAIKKQIINSPKNVDDKSYRELLILKQLNQLKQKKEYFPGGISFIGFVDWFKGQEDDQYMHYVLECADITLNDIKTITVYQYQCLFFQILFALYVAQSEYEFMHNDLHKKNVLLIKPAKGREHEYNVVTNGGVTWYTTGYQVKIADFGLSRIRLDNGQVVYDSKRVGANVFNASSDVDQVFQEFATIKISPDGWTTDSEIKELQESSGDSYAACKDKLTKSRQDQLARLKKLHRRGTDLHTIIHHPFFLPLRERKFHFLSPEQKRKRLSFSAALSSVQDEDDFLVGSPQLRFFIC